MTTEGCFYDAGDIKGNFSPLGATPNHVVTV